MLEAIGQYRILEWMGAGGLGETCRARDTRHGRTVALTVVSDEIVADPSRRRRFIEDAKRAASISHPNIAAIYEVGEEDGLVYLATEFVPGQLLSSVIGNHPMNTRRALEHAIQIADALADAHATGTPHGGIRADQIIITTKGIAKIPDFGFAVWLGKGGTPDELGDLSALGAVLFHMLTGKPPVPGWPAPPPSTINRRLPRELDAMVAKLLAMRTGPHFESAAAAAAELRALLAILDLRADIDEPLPVIVDQRSPRARIAIWLGVAAALVLVTVLIWAATRP